MVIDESAYLAHYGVKGMRWGVRKDISLTPGTKVYNISTNKPRNPEGHVYTSHTKKDVLAYRGGYASSIKNRGAEATFSNAFTVTSEVKAAGRKAQVEAFKKLWDSDKEGMAKALTVMERDIQVMAGISAKTFTPERMTAREKDMMSKGDRWVKTRGAHEFNRSLTMYEANRNVYFKEMQQRGYNAVVDLNDASKSGLHTQKPLIVFNGSTALGGRQSVKLTPDDIERATIAYRTNRSVRKYEDTVHS